MRTGKRPADRRSFLEEARRAQILEAAIATVTEVGYPNASIGAIAQRAQTSKSVISYHFAGKDELLEQVVTQVYGEIGEAVEAAIAAEQTWAAKLRAVITTELEFMGAHRARMLAASDIAVSHRGSDGTPVFLDAGEEEIAALLAILRAGQDAGEFVDVDPTVTARTIVHAIDAALTEARKDACLDLVDYGDKLVALLLRAVLVR